VFFIFSLRFRQGFSERQLITKKMLDEKLKNELKEILSEDFGIDASAKEVVEIGQELLGFFEFLVEENDP